jgi:hypothetical protein
MMKRVVLLLAVAGTAAAFSYASPAGADVNPGCAFALTGVPATYIIGPDSVAPTVTVSGDCTGKDLWADAAGLYPDAFPGTAVTGLLYGGCTDRMFDATTQKCAATSAHPYSRVSSASLTITNPSAYHVKLANASAYDFVFDGTTGVQYYTPTMPSYALVAKLATTISMTATVSGTSRTFTITPQHYLPSPHAFVNSTGVPIQLQKLVGGIWTTVLTGTPSTAPVVVTLPNTTAGMWRAVFPETSLSWSSTSSTVSI